LGFGLGTGHMSATVIYVGQMSPPGGGQMFCILVPAAESPAGPVAGAPV